MCITITYRSGFVWILDNAMNFNGHHNRIDSVRISLVISSLFRWKIQFVYYLFVKFLHCYFEAVELQRLSLRFHLLHFLILFAAFSTIRSDFNDVLSLCSVGVFFLWQHNTRRFRRILNISNRNGNKKELHSIFICYLLIVWMRKWERENMPSFAFWRPVSWLFSIRSLFLVSLFIRCF